MKYNIFSRMTMAGGVLKGMVMKIEAKPAMTPEQIVEYRKAIAPLQENFAATRSLPRRIFAGGRGRPSSSNPIPLLPGSK